VEEIKKDKKGAGRKIAIICGETSGDLYAGMLAESLHKILPETELIGFGGDLLASSGVRLLFPYAGHGEFGFTNVIRKLPSYRRHLERAAVLLLRESPDLLLFIDNPGFNLSLVKKVQTIPSIYYIPPKIWAHGYGRIHTIKRFFNAVVPISLIAKLGYTPFDIAEAETELAGGIIIEYSGRLLAIFKLMKWLLLSVGIFLLVLLFFNPGKNALLILLKYLGVLFLISLIRSTNPRLRIDQAITLFWGRLLLISLFAATLAFMGI
jgi:hypothetical protein